MTELINTLLDEIVSNSDLDSDTRKKWLAVEAEMGRLNLLTK